MTVTEREKNPCMLHSKILDPGLFKFDIVSHYHLVFCMYVVCKSLKGEEYSI